MTSATSSIASMLNKTETAQTISKAQIVSRAQELKNIDKIELHLHIGGAWPEEFLGKHATPKQFTELSHFIGLIKQGIDYHAAFDVFPLMEKIVNTDQKVEEGVVALCRKLAQDGVTQVEFRTSLKNLGSGFEGYLNAVLRGIQQGTSENPLKVGLILSLRRNTPENSAAETIDLALKYRDQGIVGIDLSGDSTSGDGASVWPSLLKAKENGLPLALHIGESEKETEEQQMKELLELNPQRVGHAVHLCGRAIEYIEDRKIPVEMCLSSALLVRMITDPNNHPALNLLKKRHPVAICTDDPTAFQVTLSEECAHVALLLGLTNDQIASLQEQASNYSFL